MVYHNRNPRYVCPVAAWGLYRCSEVLDFQPSVFKAFRRKILSTYFRIGERADRAALVGIFINDRFEPCGNHAEFGLAGAFFGMEVEIPGCRWLARSRQAQ